MRRKGHSQEFFQGRGLGCYNGRLPGHFFKFQGGTQPRFLVLTAMVKMKEFCSQGGQSSLANVCLRLCEKATSMYAITISTSQSVMTSLMHGLPDWLVGNSAPLCPFPILLCTFTARSHSGNCSPGLT